MEVSKQQATPFIPRLSAFLSVTGGVDKIYRIVSFGSRLTACILEEQGAKAAADRFRTLAGSLGETRVVFRLSGLVHMTHAILNSPARADPLLNTIANIQNASMLGYFGCENVCWLATKGGLLNWALNAQQVGTLWAQSCYFWLVWIVLDLLSVAVALRKGTLKLDGALAIRLIASFADLRLAFHYANTAKYGMSERDVGLIGTVSSIVGLHSKWTAM
eukprot:TRINITY_DN6211_c0_g2_i1.p1 TRINITY_DN6211_c0_g2~~TRINITY_DN6211_c0_g2_i1.p1  ORF type:complete len:218 (+),score=38.10 TRINITY_DN6211_c0_g2_i1:174-827(+)